jgi:hypothetical protein
MSMRHNIDLIFKQGFVELLFKKKCVTNLGTKLYNKLPKYIENLENLKPFKKQLKAYLLQQTFYSVDEYLSYTQEKKSLLT